MLRTILSCLLIGVGVLCPIVASAQGVDTERLPLVLSILPAISNWDVDDTGHLALLEGQLTPPGDTPPGRLAVTFIDMHKQLYPRADGSRFTVRAEVTVDDLSYVAVTQWIEGFQVDIPEVLCVVDEAGALIRVEGVVFHAGDVGARGGEPITKEQAIQRAASVAFGAEIASRRLLTAREIAARKMLEAGSGKRTWRVELVVKKELKLIRHTVALDAVTGDSLRSIVEDVTTLAHQPSWRPRMGGFGGAKERAASAEQSEDSADSKADASVGCTPVSPPPGDFGTSSGFNKWAAVDLNAWSFEQSCTRDPRGTWQGCAEFMTGGGPCIRGVCPDPGKIERSNVSIPVGHERVEILFPELAERLEAEFRWGLTEAASRTFHAPSLSVMVEGPYDDVAVTIFLDDCDSWHDGTVVDGAISRDLTLRFLTESTVGITGRLSAINVRPGADVRFLDAPRLLRGSVEPSTYGAGSQMKIAQRFKNYGCDMPNGTQDKFDPQPDPVRPLVTYTLHKMEAGEIVHSEEVCTDVQMNQLLNAGEVFDLSVCSFMTPEAAPENLGNWVLEGVITNHPDTPSASFEFELIEHGIPNLLVNPYTTVESWDENADGTWSRVGHVRRNEVFPVQALIMAEEYCAPDVSATLEARASFPIETDWVEVATAHFDELCSEHYTFEDVVFDDGVLPPWQPWALVDLRISASTTFDEVTHGDNELVIERWMPVYGEGTLRTAIAVALKADPLRHDGFIGETLTDVLPDPVAKGADCYVWDTDHYLYLEATNEDNTAEPRLIWTFREGDNPPEPEAVMVRYRRRRIGPIGGEMGVGWDSCDSENSQSGPGVHNTTFDIQRTPIQDDNQWHTVLWSDSGGVASLSKSPDISGSQDDSLSIQLTTDPNCAMGYVGNEYRCIDWPEHRLDFVEVWVEDTPAINPADGENLSRGLLARRPWEGDWRDDLLVPADVDGGGISETESRVAAEYRAVEPGPLVVGVIVWNHTPTGVNPEPQTVYTVASRLVEHDPFLERTMSFLAADTDVVEIERSVGVDIPAGEQITVPILDEEPVLPEPRAIEIITIRVISEGDENTQTDTLEDTYLIGAPCSVEVSQ